MPPRKRDASPAALDEEQPLKRQKEEEGLDVEESGASQQHDAEESHDDRLDSTAAFDDGAQGPPDDDDEAAPSSALAHFSTAQLSTAASNPVDNDGNSATSTILYVQRGNLRVDYETRTITYTPAPTIGTPFPYRVSVRAGRFFSLKRSVLRAARAILVNDLLFSNDPDPTMHPLPLPEIQFERLYDNFGNASPYFHFLHDHRLRFVDDGATFAIRRLIKDARRYERFATEVRVPDDQGSVPCYTLDWNVAAAKRYLSKVARFKELLAVLLVTWPALPPRPERLLGVRWRNTAQGGHRDIFVRGSRGEEHPDGGRAGFGGDRAMTVLCREHKAEDDARPKMGLKRFLKEEVAEVLVWFLWLVLPMQEILERDALGMENGSAYAADGRLFGPDSDGTEWTVDRLRAVFKSAMWQTNGLYMTLEAYDAIHRERIGNYIDVEASDALDADDDDEGMQAEQGGEQGGEGVARSEE